jgi:diphthamide synthase (EF-2-diphthine--ammonia ligase)
MARKVPMGVAERTFLAQKRADFDLMADTIEAALRLRDVDGEATDLQEAWRGRKAAEREAEDLKRQLHQMRLSIEAEAREATRAKVLDAGAQAISSGDD